MLDGVEHELVVEEADEVEAAEAGGAAQRQVSDDHARVKRPPEIHAKHYSTVFSLK